MPAPAGTHAAVFTGRAARAVRRTVTCVVFLIAGLSFVFGFGNGWALGTQLGVPGWIAPLVAPAVDLSVVALLAAVQFLRSHGLGGRLVGPRLLLVACGGITFALNTARPVLSGQVGRACFDAVAPLLLIGWSEVGPRLLALLHSTVPDEPAVGQVPVPAVLPAPPARVEQTPAVPVRPDLVPDGQRAVRDDPETVPDRPDLAPELITRAQDADSEHRSAHGRPITRDALRAHLKVSNAVAGALLRELRSSPTGNQP